MKNNDIKPFKIRLVHKNDILILSEIFSKVFTEADIKKPWDKDNSYKHLMYWLKIQPDMFFGAFKDNKPIGAIAVNIKPWRTGMRCCAGIIFVDSQYKKQKIAKFLFKKILEKAVGKYKAMSFEAVTFAGKDFPLNWYERVGLVSDKNTVLIKGDCLDILKNLF